MIDNKMACVLPHVESVAPEMTPLLRCISTLESFRMQATRLIEKNEQPFNFWHSALHAAKPKLGITLKSPPLNSKLMYTHGSERSELLETFKYYMFHDLLLSSMSLSPLIESSFLASEKEME